MDKILVNGDTHREFISNTYKQLVQLNNNNNSPNKKSSKDLNAHFPKEVIDGHKAHEKMLSITSS